MAIDPHDLLVARVSLELQLHPSPDIADTVDHDVGVFLGEGVFERMSVKEALGVLSGDDDSVAVNILRVDAILDVYAARQRPAPQTKTTSWTRRARADGQTH
jgi:hypothetical protein